MSTTSNKPFVIEQGVLLPPRRSGGIAETLRELLKAPVGSSVLFAGVSPNTVWVTVRQVCTEKVFTTRKTPDGPRVWKIAEPEAKS